MGVVSKKTTSCRQVSFVKRRGWVLNLVKTHVINYYRNSLLRSAALGQSVLGRYTRVAHRSMPRTDSELQ